MKIIRKQHTQDLSWFLDMYENGRLELTPPYQRNSVWGHKDRNFFLDTIFSNYPCPAIYLQKEITDSKIVYNVVDGKQRLQTVINFYKNKMIISKNFSDLRLAGKKWKDIETDTDLRYSFFNYSFSVEQLDCEGVVQWDEVFNRVNRNQKTLKDQELRHARFNGWLITTAENEVTKDIWSTLKIATTGRSKRMQDVEFISILMLVMLENQFIGFPQSKIDELYVKYNEFKTLEDLPEDNTELTDSDDSDIESLVFASNIRKFLTDYDNVLQHICNIINSNENLIPLIAKKPLTHVYSLWTLLAFNLGKEFTSQDVANNFEKLLKNCQEFDKTDNLADMSNSEVNDIMLAYKYFTNTKGAATEKEQRKNRHDALVEFMGWNLADESI